MSLTNDCKHFSCHETLNMPVTRRNFMVKTSLAAGVALFASFAPRLALGTGSTEALLLSCMDYRLLDHIEDYMHARGLKDKYDHIILAGASLGVLNDQYVSWGQTFWDHVEVALKLHHIHEIIILDHRDCGAYKVLLGEEYTKDASTEFTTHSHMLHQLQKKILENYPQMKVELLLMSLDGKVETIA